MKRLVRLAASFYPLSWRQRYAVEFGALLEQTGGNWKDFFDTLTGALVMQFRSWSLKRTVSVFAIFGTLAAAVIAFRIPSRYVSQSVMVFSPADGANQMGELMQQVLHRTVFEDLIQQRNLYPKERSSLPMEELVRNMQHDVTVTVLAPTQNKSGTFVVRFQYPDPKIAQSVTQALTGELVDQNYRLSRANSLHTIRLLQVLDPPSLPQVPSSPRRSRIISAGLLAGLAAGLLMSFASGWRIQIVRRSA